MFCSRKVSFMFCGVACNVPSNPTAYSIGKCPSACSIVHGDLQVTRALLVSAINLPHVYVTSQELLLADPLGHLVVISALV
jgi:hypothetical protein